MSHSDMLPSLLLKINENQLALLRNAERPRSVEIFAGPWKRSIKTRSSSR